MQVMSKAAANKREEYLKAIAPLTEQRFQHFATEQQKQEHMAYVEQHKDGTPF